MGPRWDEKIPWSVEDREDLQADAMREMKLTNGSCDSQQGDLPACEPTVVVHLPRRKSPSSASCHKQTGRRANTHCLNHRHDSLPTVPQSMVSQTFSECSMKLSDLLLGIIVARGASIATELIVWVCYSYERILLVDTSNCYVCHVEAFLR